MLKALKRIATSKKSLLATIALLGDAGAIWGFDVPVAQLNEGFMLWWNSFAALLVAAQGIIDAAQGSPSDKGA